MAKIRVFIDRDKCIGCGIAPSICPEVFLLIEDGKNALHENFREDNNPGQGIVPEELKECVEKAAEACPVGAIHFEVVEE